MANSDSIGLALKAFFGDTLRQDLRQGYKKLFNNVSSKGNELAKAIKGQYINDLSSEFQDYATKTLSLPQETYEKLDQTFRARLKKGIKGKALSTEKVEKLQKEIVNDYLTEVRAPEEEEIFKALQENIDTSKQEVKDQWHKVRSERAKRGAETRKINQLDKRITEAQENIRAIDNSADYALELEGLNSSDSSKIAADVNYKQPVPKDQQVGIKTIEQSKNKREIDVFNPDADITLSDADFELPKTNKPLLPDGSIEATTTTTEEEFFNVKTGKTSKQTTTKTSPVYDYQMNKNKARKAPQNAFWSRNNKYDNPNFIHQGEDVTKEANKNYALYGKAALGVAVAGTALCTALSSTGGQQNNAQLYGQQPLY